MEPTFPTFDRFSMPLLLLLLQGFIFVLLIAFRFFKKRNFSDLFLGLFLLLFCYQRIHYTVGFMAWYDSFPNTKINYFLFPMTLAFGPLLYFYVRTVTSARFTIKRKHIFHFLPFLFYIIYRLVLYLFDAAQPGFVETQNGILMSNLESAIVNPLFILLSAFHLLLYLAFTIQHFWFYRIRIKQFYSNTYRLELNWIRNFLILFAILFLYDVIQNIVDGFIIDLHWTQKWWFHALSCAVIIYFGIKGYFTKTEKLQDLEFKVFPLDTDVESTEVTQDYSEEKAKIEGFMIKEKPFLNPTLSIGELAKQLNYNHANLSEIINSGYQMNFNDFINTYRVEEIKEALDDKKHEQLSLVGIAYDCGFNSKATFNRVFKKLTGLSPSEYITNHNF